MIRVKADVHAGKTLNLRGLSSGFIVKLLVWLASYIPVQSTNWDTQGCPCGFYGDSTRECRCTPGIIQRYLAKVSGPLLDRIDLHIEVPAVAYKELRSQSVGTSSAEIRARVEGARQVQRDRGYYNSQIPPSQLRIVCALDETGEKTLEMAMRRMNLSARAHDRLLRVARTIADLDHSPNVAAKHIAEAVQFRNLDRNYWSWGRFLELSSH
jgi:magnesium chelatase family protein